MRRGDTVELLTLERGLELLAGRRAWEAENGGSPKKSKRAKKSSPSLTANTVKATGKAKKKKAATGESKVAQPV